MALDKCAECGETIPEGEGRRGYDGGKNFHDECYRKIHNSAPDCLLCKGKGLDPVRGGPCPECCGGDDPMYSQPISMNADEKGNTAYKGDRVYSRIYPTDHGTVVETDGDAALVDWDGSVKAWIGQRDLVRMEKTNAADDVETVEHMKKCGICSKADGPEDMCEMGRNLMEKGNAQKSCPSCGAPMVVINPQAPGLIQRRCTKCGEETRGEEGLREYGNSYMDPRCSKCGGPIRAIGTGTDGKPAFWCKQCKAWAELKNAVAQCSVCGAEGVETSKIYDYISRKKRDVCSKESCVDAVKKSKENAKDYGRCRCGAALGDYPICKECGHAVENSKGYCQGCGADGVELTPLQDPQNPKMRGAVRNLCAHCVPGFEHDGWSRTLANTGDSCELCGGGGPLQSKKDWQGVEWKVCKQCASDKSNFIEAENSADDVPKCPDGHGFMKQLPTAETSSHQRWECPACKTRIAMLKNAGDLTSLAKQLYAEIIKPNGYNESLVQDFAAAHGVNAEDLNEALLKLPEMKNARPPFASGDTCIDKHTGKEVTVVDFTPGDRAASVQEVSGFMYSARVEDLELKNAANCASCRHSKKLHSSNGCAGLNCDCAKYTDSNMNATPGRLSHSATIDGFELEIFENLIGSSDSEFMYRIDGVPSSLRFPSLDKALLVAQSEIGDMVRERETKNAVATPPMKEKWQMKILKLQGQRALAAEADKQKFTDEIKQLETEMKEMGNSNLTHKGCGGKVSWKGEKSGFFVCEKCGAKDLLETQIKNSDKANLERNVVEEVAAINLYEGQKCGADPKVADLLEHVIKDEREHVMEFQETLKDEALNTTVLKVGDKVRFKDIVEDEAQNLMIPPGTQGTIYKEIGGGLFRAKGADGQDLGCIIYPEDVELANESEKPNATPAKVGDQVKAVGGLMEGQVVGLFDGGYQVKWDDGSTSEVAYEEVNAIDPAVKDRDLPEAQ